jgi:hypothetical protein
MASVSTFRVKELLVAPVTYHTAWSQGAERIRNLTRGLRNYVKEVRVGRPWDEEVIAWDSHQTKLRMKVLPAQEFKTEMTEL